MDKKAAAWDFRIVKLDNRYSVREVFYNNNGEPEFCSDEGERLEYDSIADLFETLAIINRCVSTGSVLQQNDFVINDVVGTIFVHPTHRHRHMRLLPYDYRDLKALKGMKK
jgi:hypothetical protein